MTSQSMKQDNTEMKHEDTMMKSDEMGMKQDTMRMEQSMTSKRSYVIPDDAELRRRLTPLQYAVTRKNDTERPFANTYWDNHEPGIYVDVVSGEPLFSSTDKYASGTGWPSFTRPLEPGNIVEKEDRSFFSVRTEVRSKNSRNRSGWYLSTSSTRYSRI